MLVVIMINGFALEHDDGKGIDGNEKMWFLGLEWIQQFSFLPISAHNVRIVGRQKCGLLSPRMETWMGLVCEGGVWDDLRASLRKGHQE